MLPATPQARKPSRFAPARSAMPSQPSCATVIPSARRSSTESTVLSGVDHSNPRTPAHKRAKATNNPAALRRSGTAATLARSPDGRRRSAPAQATGAGGVMVDVRLVPLREARVVVGAAEGGLDQRSPVGAAERVEPADQGDL